MKKLKVVGLVLLIGAGLSANSFGSEISDPYIPAMTGMVKDSQQEQSQQERKTAEQSEEIKQADSKSKEENIKAETRKKANLKKKKYQSTIKND